MLEKVLYMFIMLLSFQIFGNSLQKSNANENKMREICQGKNPELNIAGRWVVSQYADQVVTPI